MRYLCPAFLLLLFGAQTIFPASIGSVAELVLVEDRGALIEQLTPALIDADPRVRATAARVVTVRGITELLEPVAKALANESDLETAREQIRALAISGDRASVERAFELAKRFNGRLDGDVGTATARRGVPDALELYFSKVKDLSLIATGANYFQTALWGRPDLAPLVGSRLLAARDARGWVELLEALEQSDVLVDLGVAVAGLHMETPADEFAVPTAWYLARSIACEGERPGCRIDFSPVGRQLLFDELREPDSGPDSLRYPRELLRRVLGTSAYDTPAAKRTKSPYLTWLASAEADLFLAQYGILSKYMRADEWKAFSRRRDIPKTTHRSQQRYANQSGRAADLPPPLRAAEGGYP